MTRHTYRVVQAFDSVGAHGVKRFEVGQLVERDQPAKSSQHLELVSEGEPEPVRDLAAELALAEQRIADLGAGLDQLGADAAADRKAAEDAITEAAQLRAKVAELETALAATVKGVSVTGDGSGAALPPVESTGSTLQTSPPAAAKGKASK